MFGWLWCQRWQHAEAVVFGWWWSCEFGGVDGWEVKDEWRRQLLIMVDVVQRKEDEYKQEENIVFDAMI